MIFLLLFLSSLTLMSVLALLPTVSEIKFTLNGSARLEFTVAFLKIELYDFGGGKNKSSITFYKKLAKRITELLSHSAVKIEDLKISIPKQNNYTNSHFIIPYLYHAAISALIAYLKSKSEKLSVRENAVCISSENEDGISLGISLRAELFYVLRAIVQILADQRADAKTADKKRPPRKEARAYRVKKGS